MHDTDERDVVDFVRNVLVRRPGDGRLELAREVGVAGVADLSLDDLFNRWCSVNDLVSGNTGNGGAEHNPRGVSTSFRRAEADCF